jgi:Tfp pilus assembly protein PilF
MKFDNSLHSCWVARLLASGLIVVMLSACGSTASKPAQSTAPQEIPPAAQTLFDSAVAAQREQQWAQAEQQLKQLVEKYPQLSGPHLNLALIYAQTQRNEQAEVEFKNALQINPNNIPAYDQYAIWLRGQVRLQEAEAIYLKALERAPDHADTHLNLGILYDLYMGKLPQALVQYQRYLELANDEKSPVNAWVGDLQRRLKPTQ